MSQENVELVNRLIAAWNRRDLEAILALTDPDITFVNNPEAVEPGTRRGHDELSAVFRKQWEGLGASARQQIDQIHARDDEVITANRVSREMPGGGGRLENRVALRWVFRDGRVIRFEFLGAGSGFKAALEAAGLSE